MDLPEWLLSWCRQHLGALPADVLMHEPPVTGMRLTDGREVLVKARPD